MVLLSSVFRWEESGMVQVLEGRWGCSGVVVS